MKKFIKSSLAIGAMATLMMFSASNFSIACENEDTTTEFGNTVHYSNKENNTWKPGCHRSCDGVCVIRTGEPEPVLS